jgi:hypothetical protein
MKAGFLPYDLQGLWIERFQTLMRKLGTHADPKVAPRRATGRQFLDTKRRPIHQAFAIVGRSRPSNVQCQVQKLASSLLQSRKSDGHSRCPSCGLLPASGYCTT